MVKADWNNSSIYKEIKRDEIMRLKQMPGKNIIIYGSASIVKGLSEMGLIDEYQILVYPVLLGSGKRLFDSKEGKIALKLLNTDTYSSGVAAMSYAPQIKEV
jgi:dihydrofolate reductase